MPRILISVQLFWLNEGVGVTGIGVNVRSICDRYSTIMGIGDSRRYRLNIADIPNW
jgi:hypothetical protein